MTNEFVIHFCGDVPTLVDNVGNKIVVPYFRIDKNGVALKKSQRDQAVVPNVDLINLHVQNTMSSAQRTSPDQQHFSHVVVDSADPTRVGILVCNKLQLTVEQ